MLKRRRKQLALASVRPSQFFTATNRLQMSGEFPQEIHQRRHGEKSNELLGFGRQLADGRTMWETAGSGQNMAASLNVYALCRIDREERKRYLTRTVQS